MSALVTKRLGTVVGAEVLEVDVDRLLDDDDLPGQCLEALEAYGVLLFRELHPDDEAQVAFCRRLGELITFPAYANPYVMEISFEPGNPNAEYFRSNDHWHIDGALDGAAPPPKASVMSGRVITTEGGETEFASTYAAYENLTDAEKERFAALRVLHTFEAIQRLSYPNPTPAQLAEWSSPKRPPREHPLVWAHRSGRRSLVIGSTASHVIGMDRDEGRALLDDLQRRTTASERVLSHRWSAGDMVIWDNQGLVHRVRPFDLAVPRRMHRTTLVGDEPIQ
jgi:alpha-ketoglutarate-dependent taurine dioxygenase